MGEFMQGGIKIKTMNDYGKDIKRFQAHLRERGEAAEVRNHLLEPIEEGVKGTRNQVVELVHYAMKLSEDKTLTPSAFDDQFNAIRRFMLNNLVDVSVFDMECVKEARRIARDIVSKSRAVVIEAMGPAERTTYEARFGEKMPFTEDMMLAHREDYFGNEGASVEDNMAYVATALMYHVGNRPSEGSSNGPRAKDSKGKSDEDHRYTVEDIQYQLTDGTFICGTDINETNKEEIQYISVMVNSHKGETIKAKATKGATKRQPNAVRRDNGEMELQLFTDLIEWPEIAKLRPNDYFFSRNATNKGKLSNLKLTTRAVVSRMKATAEKQGVNPTLISAKSLRRALGTDLTRSNISKEAINACGRWSKNSNTCATNYALLGQGREYHRDNVRRNKKVNQPRTTAYEQK